jgi:hypothetical protein
MKEQSFADPIQLNRLLVMLRHLRLQPGTQASAPTENQSDSNGE